MSKYTFEKPIPLEETLRYFATLINPNLDCVAARANAMGMERRRFEARIPHPDWKLARQICKEMTPEREKTFAQYVLNQMSEEARKTWADITFWKEHKDAPQKLFAINQRLSRRIKQELFVHALLANGFDQSKALYLCCISAETLKDWNRQDLHFAQLLEEIHWHKKNFFEKAMVDLVSNQHPLAIIYANKTLNADRGYNEKIRIEHAISADAIDFGTLDLDLETKKKVLAAIRKQREPKATVTTPVENGNAFQKERKQLTQHSTGDTVEEAEVVE